MLEVKDIDYKLIQWRRVKPLVKIEHPGRLLSGANRCTVRTSWRKGILATITCPYTEVPPQVIPPIEQVQICFRTELYPSSPSSQPSKAQQDGGMWPAHLSKWPKETWDGSGDPWAKKDKWVFLANCIQLKVTCNSCMQIQLSARTCEFFPQVTKGGTQTSKLRAGSPGMLSVGLAALQKAFSGTTTNVYSGRG